MLQYAVINGFMNKCSNTHQSFTQSQFLSSQNQVKVFESKLLTYPLKAEYVYNQTQDAEDGIKSFK